MKTCTILFALVFSVQLLYAQGVRTSNFLEENYKKGKAFYDDSKYPDAIAAFEAVLSSNAEHQDALYYLGLSYRYASQMEKAIETFKKLEKLNPDYWAYFYYEMGIAYQTLEQHSDAVVSFDLFLDKFPKEAKRIQLRHKAQYRKNYSQKSPEIRASAQAMKDPIRLAELINSNFDDYFPTLDPTGTKLYFTSKRPNGNEAADEESDEDIYYVEKNGDVWGTPIRLPEPINTDGHDGAACFSADGQFMIYGTCGAADGIGSCDMYYAVNENGQWSKSVNMGNVVNTKEWDAQYSLSYDGSKIFFASEREGGYGGTDLYMVEKNIFGEWGIPTNLGSIVNTPLSEYNPFFSQDGKTLYFASNGHPGFGGMDIFKTVFENGKWSTPVNLGKPLNTAAEDRYFTIGGSGEIGYFASNRDDKGLDIYQIEIPEDMRPQPTVIVNGIVTDNKTHKPLGAYVMVEDINTGDLIAVNKSNSVTGKYLVVLPAGKTYSVSANKEGFFFYSNRFDVPASAKFEEITKDIALKPIEKGAKVVLNNIFFETGKAALSPESRVELEKAIELMKHNPTMIIEVGGHTDNVGDDATNMKLSHDRAKAVRDYLMNSGIKSERMQAKGYGEMNPIATNDTDEGRKANRRTEFVILEF